MEVKMDSEQKSESGGRVMIVTGSYDMHVIVTGSYARHACAQNPVKMVCPAVARLRTERAGCHPVFCRQQRHTSTRMLARSCQLVWAARRSGGLWLHQKTFRRTRVVVDVSVCASKCICILRACASWRTAPPSKTQISAQHGNLADSIVPRG